MANRGDDSPGEDLFDDLDRFFAPIEETDWPEPDPSLPPAPRPGRTPRPPRDRSVPPEPQAELEPPAGGDLFPQGWDDLETDTEAEEGLLEASAVPGPEDTATYEFNVEEDAAATALGADEDDDDLDEDDLGDELEDGTSVADEAVWNEVQLSGEGEDEEAIILGAPASRGDEEREPGELTIDDLKVAPPEYANLPGPGADETASTGSSIFGDDEPAFATAEPPRTPPAPPPPDEDFFQPPPAGAAERAADHFAEGVRTDPGSVEDDLMAGLDQAGPSAPRTVKVGVDEPVMGAGPAWEDPSSHAVGSEGAGGDPRGGRNLSAALISGVGLAAVALILLAIGPAPFGVLAGAVILAAQAELYAVARTRGFQPATALGLAVGGLIIYAGYNKGPDYMAAMLILGTMFSFLWYMAAPAQHRKGTLANVSVTVLGLVYVTFMPALIFGILPLVGGRAIVIGVIALTVIYDVAAFAFGSLWGNRSLAPTISPNKSLEGAFAASVITFVVALAFGPMIEPFTAASSIGLALVVIVMAPVGDLAESALKRDLGVKDMSTIMPGHGGLMDRIDSLLFVLPAAYFFLLIAFF